MKPRHAVLLFVKMRINTYSDSRYKYKTYNTSISCRWWTCTMCCITANMLQRKVDAQCDKPKLATLENVESECCKCKWGRL